MTRAARWTGTVAVLATLCAAALGVDADCEGAETARSAEVIAIGPATGWSRPLTRDCTAGSSEARATAARAVLRYREGSRYDRRWHTARVLAPAGLRVGDRVRFDATSCGLLPPND